MFPFNTIIAWYVNIYHKYEDMIITTLLLPLGHICNTFLALLPLVFHYLFAELVHLYTWQVYWVCWGHKRLLVSWLQGCLRGNTFDHFLPEFDKPWVIHLRENLLLFYKPLHLEAQQLSTRIEVRRHQAIFWRRCWGGKVKGTHILWILSYLLVLLLVCECSKLFPLDYAIISFCFLFLFSLVRPNGKQQQN